MPIDPSPDIRRIWGAVVLSALVLGGVIGVYPLVLDAALLRFGIRPVAGALLLLALAGAVASRRGLGPTLAAGGAALLGLPVLLALAAVSGEGVYLRLLPALVYLALAGFFQASLRESDSLVERMVRFVLPIAPDFIRSYCRVLTRLWVGFFGLTAVVIAWLALAGPASWWRAWTGWIVFASMLGVSLLEFLVRKTWFRYYFFGGPFDRFWSRLFPAENTPQGRRSQEYIRRRRAEFGLDPPTADTTDPR